MVASRFHSLAECPFFSKALSSMDRTAREKEDSGPHYCSCHTGMWKSEALIWSYVRKRTRIGPGLPRGRFSTKILFKVKKSCKYAPFIKETKPLQHQWEGSACFKEKQTSSVQSFRQECSKGETTITVCFKHMGATQGIMLNVSSYLP